MLNILKTSHLETKTAMLSILKTSHLEIQNKAKEGSMNKHKNQNDKNIETY